MPEIRKIHCRRPSEEALAWAGRLIRQEGVVVYPTETFYGLGAHPCLEEAVRRVYSIKGRAFDKPLPLIAGDMEAVLGVVERWTEEAERLAAAFWPGPLTLVLPASRRLPPVLHARTGKVALRVSSSIVARELARMAGGVLVSTSANAAGMPPCRRFPDIDSDLLSRVDAALDAGDLPGLLPSTIVDASGDAGSPPRLLRAGGVSREEIEKVLPLA